MLTYLDLLVIVAMALAGASLISMCLMFLVRHRRFRQICLYVVAVLSLYTAYIGIRIGLGLFTGQVIVALLVALAAIASVVLERVGRKNEKLFLFARILAALSLIVGLINAFT